MANTTWNPSDKAAGITLSGGNLIAKNNNNAVSGVRGVHRQNAGRYYWEYTCNTFTFAANSVGVITATPAVSLAPGVVAQSVADVITNGSIFIDGVSAGKNIGAITAGAVVCIAMDCDSHLIWFRLGAVGNWNASASANPATGVLGLSVNSSGLAAFYPRCVLTALNDQVTANFGDTAFTGAVPSGFTSGFPDTTPTLAAIAAQASVEQWADGAASARLTQIASEQWATPTGVGVQALMTQIAVEQWGALPVTATTAPIVVIMA